VQARACYRFELMTMLALGAMFEIPVLLLAVGRACVLSSATLRRHRGYAIVGLSVLGGAPARHRPGQRHGLGAWHSG
jgi:sec-independent protein translocase protein TatC